MNVYLDMDGVQVDFFGAWADYHRVSHYKETSEEHFERFSRKDPDHIRNFFSNLPKLHDGAIAQWLQDRNIPFTVLSAPLRNDGATPSVEGKKMWLDKNLPGYSQHAIFTRHKYTLAMTGNKPCLLIDDFGKYVEEWRQHGGVAIKHENLQDTLEQLNNLYERNQI